MFEGNGLFWNGLLEHHLEERSLDQVQARASYYPLPLFRQTTERTRAVHLNAPGQRHGQQPRLRDRQPPE